MGLCLWEGVAAHHPSHRLQGVARMSERPWPVTGLTTRLWIDTVPARPVNLDDIIPTQRHLDLNALINEPHTVDPHPHIVQWQGVLYLEDGHHRYARAKVRGEDSIVARVFVATEAE